MCLPFAYQRARLSLVHLGNALMMLGCHCEASHVGVDVNGLHQAIDGAIDVHLLVAVGCIYVASASIVATAGACMQRCCLTEAFAGLCPVL